MSAASRAASVPAAPMAMSSVARIAASDGALPASVPPTPRSSVAW
jgi:hypothetical protein